MEGGKTFVNNGQLRLRAVFLIYKIDLYPRGRGNWTTETL